MDIQKALCKAIHKIADLPSNTNFQLKDLYDGVQWDSFTKGDRNSMGRYFKNEVMENRIPKTQYVGKSQDNVAIYRKV